MTIFRLGSTRAGEVDTAEDSGGARQRERGPEACTRMRRCKHDSLGVCHQLRPAASLGQVLAVTRAQAAMTGR
jgi:hypothetical protein